MEEEQTVIHHEYEEMSWWRSMLWVLVLVGGAWLALNIQSTLISFALAWLIAYLLNPIVEAIHRERRVKSRGLAIAIVYTLLLGFLVAGASLLVPQVSAQVQKVVALQSVLDDPIELRFKIQEKADFFMEQVHIPDQYQDQLYLRVSQFIQSSTAQIGSWVGKIAQYLATFIGQMVSGLLILLTGLLISIYMLENWHDMGDNLVEWLPPNYQDDARSLGFKMNEIFGGYLKATIITSFACMVATFVSLWILTLFYGAHFPYIFLLSFVAGITYPIPVVGILGSSLLGGVLGFFPENDLTFAFLVLVVVNLVNNIIDRTVQPKLMSDAIGVSPLFVMFGAFAGGELMGVWGMLIGIPVAAMAKTLFVWFHGRFLITGRKLSDPPPEELQLEAAVADESESLPGGDEIDQE